MPTPSLILVPARFKTGKLYTPLATTSGGVVLGASGDFNVTRATTATRVNASGFIEVVASGVPRLDYYTSGGTAGCPALLVEPAATNFAPNVNLMTGLDTPTVSGGVTLTTGSTDFLAPDGASGSINKYVGGAASGNTQNSRYGAASLIVNASGTYRFSLFVKAGTTNPLNFCAIAFSLFTGGSGTSSSFFNLASGTAITAGASIENYGDGWYRCISAPYTIASSDLSGTVYFNLASSSGSISWPASGALNLTAYTWGAQMEAGSVATSYIPTTTGSITRNADVVTLSGAVSGCIGQTEGTIYAEVVLSRVNTSPLITISDGSDSNRIQIAFASATSLIAIIRIAGANANYTVTIPTIPATGGVYKMALGYKTDDYCFALNGTAYASTASKGVPASNKIGLGTSATDGAFLNDRIRAAALYTTRLTDSELAALTTL